eukprot:6639634-Prymnesium_polylepis.1
MRKKGAPLRKSYATECAEQPVLDAAASVGESLLSCRYRHPRPPGASAVSACEYRRACRSRYASGCCGHVAVAREAEQDQVVA